MTDDEKRPLDDSYDHYYDQAYDQLSELKDENGIEFIRHFAADLVARMTLISLTLPPDLLAQAGEAAAEADDAEVKPDDEEADDDEATPEPDPAA